MLEWTFGFWQMLSMLFCAYYIGGFVSRVSAAMKHVAEPKNNHIIVPITIERVGDALYAFNEDTKEFLVQSTTYEDLQKQLSVMTKNAKCDITYVTDLEALEKVLNPAK